MIRVKFRKAHKDATTPRYATDGSGCFDLFPLLEHGVDRVVVRPEFPEVFRTGLKFEVPADHVMLIFSRSGQGFNHGVRLANCVGVIDSDYRGEVKIKLTADEQHAVPLVVKRNEAAAQGMVLPIERVVFEEVEELSETVRGDGGFGSTDNAA